MKNITLLLTVLVLILTGCSNDDKNDPEPTLSLDKESITFYADGTPASGNTFTITSNSEWEISSSESWCTVQLVNGVNVTNTYSVSVGANDTSEPRSATITVNLKTASLVKTLTVTQSEDNNQIVNLFDYIPDPSFNAYCQQFDTNNDAILTHEEALAVTRIKLSDEGIDNVTSLEGI